MTTTTFAARRHSIDNRCEILAGLRMTSDRSTGRWGYHRSPELEARQRKMPWAPSETHPDGVDKWAADLDIADDGEIRIPHDAVEPYFYGKDAHLMLNIFCDMPQGGDFFAVVGFKKYPDKENPGQFKGTELYGFDREEPQIADGRWQYSRPIHLHEAGKFNSFYFMTLRVASKGFVELTVQKFTVTRGKKHYRLKQEKCFPAKDAQRRGVMNVETLQQLATTDRDLRDLPIAKLIHASAAWKNGR